MLLKSINQILLGIFGVILVLMFLYICNLSKSSTIATVNITGIIDQFVKTEAKKNLTPEILKTNIKEFGTRLEATIQELAKQKHAILFPSEAVIAGGKDYTDQVVAELNRNRDEK